MVQRERFTLSRMNMKGKLLISRLNARRISSKLIICAHLCSPNSSIPSLNTTRPIRPSPSLKRCFSSQPMQIPGKTRSLRKLEREHGRARKNSIEKGKHSRGRGRKLIRSVERLGRRWLR